VKKCTAHQRNLISICGQYRCRAKIESPPRFDVADKIKYAFDVSSLSLSVCIEKLVRNFEIFRDDVHALSVRYTDPLWHLCVVRGFDNALSGNEK